MPTNKIRHLIYPILCDNLKIISEIRKFAFPDFQTLHNNKFMGIKYERQCKCVYSASPLTNNQHACKENIYSLSFKTRSENN